MSSIPPLSSPFALASASSSSGTLIPVGAMSSTVLPMIVDEAESRQFGVVYSDTDRSALIPLNTSAAVTDLATGCDMTARFSLARRDALNLDLRVHNIPNLSAIHGRVLLENIARPHQPDVYSFTARPTSRRSVEFRASIAPANLSRWTGSSRLIIDRLEHARPSSSQGDIAVLNYYSHNPAERPRYIFERYGNPQLTSTMFDSRLNKELNILIEQVSKGRVLVSFRDNRGNRVVPRGLCNISCGNDRIHTAWIDHKGTLLIPTSLPLTHMAFTFSLNVDEEEHGRIPFTHETASAGRFPLVGARALFTKVPEWQSWYQRPFSPLSFELFHSGGQLFLGTSSADFPPSACGTIQMMSAGKMHSFPWKIDAQNQRFINHIPFDGQIVESAELFINVISVWELDRQITYAIASGQYWREHQQKQRADLVELIRQARAEHN